MAKTLALLVLLNTISSAALAFKAGTGTFYKCESPSRIEFLMSINSWDNSATIPGNYPNILEILSKPGAIGLNLISKNPETWSLQYGPGGAGIELGTCQEIQ